jgi:hypothetical protein
MNNHDKGLTNERRNLQYIMAKKKYVEQEEQIHTYDDAFEIGQLVHTELMHVRNATRFLDPQVKYWTETVSKSKEIIVRRENRIYYAICVSASTLLSATWGAFTIAPTGAIIGWMPVSLPDGAKITIQAANSGDNVPCLVAVSNAPIVLGVNTLPTF